MPQTALRKKYPSNRVITRGWDDDDNIARTIEAHRGPVALIGHSFGGCRMIELTEHLRRKIEYLIVLDPVPCDSWAFPKGGFRLPPQALTAICFYRPAGFFPFSCPLLAAPPETNRMRHLGHSEFCSNTEVHRCILDACAKAQPTPDRPVPSASLAEAR